jgi:hypothetical protein
VQLPESRMRVRSDRLAPAVQAMPINAFEQPPVRTILRAFDGR